LNSTAFQFANRRYNFVLLFLFFKRLALLINSIHTTPPEATTNKNPFSFIIFKQNDREQSFRFLLWQRSLRQNKETNPEISQPMTALFARRQT